MATPLTLDAISTVAKIAGYDPAAVRAVLAVETGGRGFDAKTGKILIQFEPHWFRRYTKHKIANEVSAQPLEWRAFNQAFRLNPTAAMLSTSWGLGQIMGFNHAAAGFATVDAMVDSFKESEANQLRGMLRFIRSKRALHKSLLDKDWRTFAHFYNGPAYAVHNYHGKLAAAYQRISLQAAPVVPASMV